MLNINTVLSAKHLWCDYLPKRLLIFIIPVGLGIHIFMDKKVWAFFWMFSVLAITTEIMKYYKCKRKHEELIMSFGDRYIGLLKHEIEHVGVNALVARFWVGLEPKQ